MICLIFAKLKGSSLGLSSGQKILSFLLIHSITFKPNKGRGQGAGGGRAWLLRSASEAEVQRRRLRRRRSALLRLCASDSPVPHTKGLSSPPSAAFQLLGPRRAGSGDPRGAPGRISRAAWPLGHPLPPRETSPNFPQTRRAGEGPRLKARMRPARCSAFPGLPGAGVESVESPRRSAYPQLPGLSGLGCCLSSWKLEVAAWRRALRSLLFLRMEVSKRGSRKRRAERRENGLNKGSRWNPELLLGRPGATTSPGWAGSPRRPPTEGPVTWGASCGELVSPLG